MQLSFEFLPSEFSNDHQVRILADGQDLLEKIDKSSLGLDPVEFFAQPTLHTTGWLLIGRCECGCAGCDDVRAAVTRTEQDVLWDLASRGMQFSFALPDYDEAMKIGAADFSWETPQRTAERLVSKLDYSEFARYGLVFGWASARIEENQMTLSFMKDGNQILYKAPWDSQEPSHAVATVQQMLPYFLEQVKVGS